MVAQIRAKWFGCHGLNCLQGHTETIISKSKTLSLIYQTSLPVVTDGTMFFLFCGLCTISADRISGCGSPKWKTSNLGQPTSRSSGSGELELLIFYALISVLSRSTGFAQYCSYEMHGRHFRSRSRQTSDLQDFRVLSDPRQAKDLNSCEPSYDARHFRSWSRQTSGF